MKHAGMQQRDESEKFLEGADYGMSTNWYWNRQTDRRSEKENGNENPVLHYCSGGIKKPSELLEAWQSPFPVRWFQTAKIQRFSDFATFSSKKSEITLVGNEKVRIFAVSERKFQTIRVSFPRGVSLHRHCPNT